MNDLIIYRNDLVVLAHIPLEGGGFSRQFYILDAQNTNLGAYHPGVNGFTTIQKFIDSIERLLFLKENYKYEDGIMDKWINIYNSIEVKKIEIYETIN